MMTIINFYYDCFSSFVIIDPNIPMVRRLTISAARHAQRVRPVHKEGLQLELTVMLVKVFFYSFFSVRYHCLHLNLLSCLSSPWMPESSSFIGKWTRTWW